MLHVRSIVRRETVAVVGLAGFAIILFVSAAIAAEAPRAGDAALGTITYDAFDTPQNCGECHTGIYQQWQQAMMSQSYTHHWDEIEYFALAVPHAEKDSVVAGVKAGCNGCHAPLAFLAGDIPPARPEANSRANESVSCDLCHSLTGFEGDTPYNFNFIAEPGTVKFGPRETIESAAHEGKLSTFLASAEFCGTCHNEKDPYGIWVKSTHLEWKESTYAAQGITCQDCHMTSAEGATAEGGTVYADARQHLFHGAHDPGKLRGTVELRIHPDTRKIRRGTSATFTVALFNQKAGHMFPTGSVEDRIVWLHVEARDAAGTIYHLPVDKKGFDGEEWTIAADVLAYQDMGIALNDPTFKGVQRDGVPVGDRIFRMPYLDPQGRMTIQQWNTKSLGVDYRLAPLRTKLENYTFVLPADAAPGEMTVTATLYYSKLVKPVADFLGVPAEEAEPVVINDHSTMLTVVP